MILKTCALCGNEKDEIEFSWKIKSKIRRARCKLCTRKHDNQNYKNSKKRRKTLRKNALSRNDFIRKYIQRLKKFGSCKFCGDNRWYVLDFHHLVSNDKNIGISQIIPRGYSMKRLKTEIRKCILLCSNCHRELHYFKNKK